MKRKNFRSKLALIAAAAMTMSLGTGFTASADSYRAVAVPDLFGANSYVYVSDPYTGSRNPVSCYEPIAPQRTEASGDSDKAKAGELVINSTNFPDPKFLVYVADNFDEDTSGTLSDDEISKATYINVNNLGISTLKGIENFTGLKTLYCDNNIIASIDLSKNTALTVLNCYNNKLSSLNVRNNAALITLNCGYNNITSLDLSNNMSLVSLHCYNNRLTSLDVSEHKYLTYLMCDYNSLTSLNVSGCTSLKQIICQYNKLKSLDISSNAALEQLWCSYNYFSGKSDIVGLDEEALTDCDYKTQYYEGYVFYPGNALINNMDTLNFTKVITGRISNFLHTDKYQTPDDIIYDGIAAGEKVVGKPENVVTSDGIVFIPANGYELTWRSGDGNAIFNVTSIITGAALVTAYAPGVYTLSLTIKNYDGNGGVFTKDFEITAVNIEDHTVHEFPAKFNLIYTAVDDKGLVTVECHAKECFCGEKTDVQPHSYDSELKIIPYLDGTNMYYKYCPVCGYQKLIGGGKSNAETLTDSITKVSATILEGTIVPENTQLFVTDVTDTETVDVKGKAAVYDISLKSGGVEVQPENGKIAVTIPVPDNVNGARAKVFRKEANGSFTDMKAVYNPRSKTLSFVTDHLSIYAVASSAVLGDVNGDGKINNADIIMLGRAYMSGNGNDYLDVADMNDDKVINNADIILLGRLYMSMPAQ